MANAKLRLRVDQAVHRVVVGYPVCGAGDLLELFAVGRAAANGANPTEPASSWSERSRLLRPIILRRVDSDWDCERLAAERDDLFPPTPDVDW